MDDTKLVITNDDGTEEVCEIILTHEANGKKYVIFEFLETEEVSSAVYLPGATEEEGQFIDIETDEEWAMLDEVLDAFYGDFEEDDEDEEN